MPPPTAKALLHEIARLYNIQTAYNDAFGQRVESPPEAILCVLKTLGAPAEKFDDLSDALRQRRQRLWQRCIDPVLITWNRRPLTFRVRLPIELAETTVKYQIALETGELLEGECHERNMILPAREIEGMRYVTRQLAVLEKLPMGYHRLRLHSGAISCEAHLFSSWLHTYAPSDSPKRWGIFCPLYALNSERSWGAGDLSELGAMIDFTAQMGGDVVGTLPLLPAFLDEPFNPSPYAPVSRRFWNEFYLDITQVAEFQRCPIARTITESAGFQSELQRARAGRFIDYRRLMASKRRVLEELLRCFLDQNSPRQESFDDFVDTHSSVQDYAAFRAKVERERKVWQLWPAANRDGMLASGEFDESVKQYHLYVQWQCHEQVRVLGAKAEASGTKLYLDFPLGVNRDGYDVWREPCAFALDASGGAPPDGFFSRGQNWGFAPPHPDGLREQGYRHYAQCLRHHMQPAGMLRVDHILGLHRLYWIPQGFAANEGVYVRYHAEEFYAVLSLESHRHQVQIVGENLGTVPAYVNAAMARHNVMGMRVGQFSVHTDPQKAFEEIPAKTIVSLNTHDTPTFSGFWNGSDIQDRIDLGLLVETQSVAEYGYRAAQKDAMIQFLKARGWLSEDPDWTDTDILKGWLSYLASGDGELLLVNLEDLWLEPLPQNVPGTWEERPNWQRKALLLLETIRQHPTVVEVLTAVNRLRQGDKANNV